MYFYVNKSNNYFFLKWGKRAKRYKHGNPSKKVTSRF